MISTADLQDWMKADDADAPVLRSLEEAAIKAIEQLTGRYYGITSTITEVIRFGSWPLSLANDPDDGVLTSLSQWDGSSWVAVASTDYFVDGSLIWPNSTFTWPAPWLVSSTSQRFMAIYQAGYTVDPLDPDVWLAPADIQQAVKLLVGHWFENRESVVVGETAQEIPLSVQMLVSSRARVAV